MIAFPSVKAIIDWWRVTETKGPMCLLLDNTSIGLGIQRREIRRTKTGGWVLDIWREG